MPLQDGLKETRVREGVAAAIVVDDSRDARRAISEVVSAAASCRLVGEAESGEEAVTLVRDMLPDLVLLDVRMPGIGGIEAARRIIELRPETVVVLVSALPESQLPSGARSSGAVAILAKEHLCPTELDRLWATYGLRRET